MSEKFGKIAQVIGPVVDVIFDGEDNLIPPIYTALKVTRPEGGELILEVEQHIGEDTVRCVAMESTDGLRRGMRVDNLERPIAVPTGEQVKGRLLNVIGDAIDRLPELKREELRPIHQPAPKFDDLTIGTEILFTGIKVIDLLEPYSKGGKIGLFGGAVWARQCSSWSSSTTSPKATTASRCSPVSASVPVKATTFCAR